MEAWVEDTPNWNNEDSILQRLLKCDKTEIR